MWVGRLAFVDRSVHGRGMPARTGVHQRIQPTDLDLIDQVRGGSNVSYRALYERHQPSARQLAWQLTHNHVQADDLVAESFARVLAALRRNSGPTTAFRAYLLATLRNVAHENERQDRRTSLRAEITEADDTAPGPAEQLVEKAERSRIATAFTALPQRWRAVLWLTAVEGEQHTKVAGLLGLTPNGVSSLAFRARAGLRRAYLG